MAISPQEAVKMRLAKVDMQKIEKAIDGRLIKGERVFNSNELGSDEAVIAAIVKRYEAAGWDITSREDYRETLYSFSSSQDDWESASLHDR